MNPSHFLGTSACRRGTVRWFKPGTPDGALDQISDHARQNFGDSLAAAGVESPLRDDHGEPPGWGRIYDRDSNHLSALNLRGQCEVRHDSRKRLSSHQLCDRRQALAIRSNRCDVVAGPKLLNHDPKDVRPPWKYDR